MSEHGGNRRTLPDDESNDEAPFYNDFETCAQSVALLYKECNWRNLQIAATTTTQLYKSGVDAKKRAMERGIQMGRQTLAKELLAACRVASRFDAQILINHLSKAALLPPEALSELAFRGSPNHRNAAYQNHESSGVLLFQQALTNPNSTHNTSVPSRNAAPDLNNFLTSQVHRHRKRQHSPTFGSSNGYSKRVRKS
ncbi:hypothetical protein L596_007328 [Steinernema carpocapsae]|nr:hypothetical protein L596_007328 [Steinernema carpocapsae]